MEEVNLTRLNNIAKYPQLYWDNFANEVVIETEDIAPPERYTRLYCGNAADVYIEKWRIGPGRYIDVAYSTFARDHGLVWLARKEAEDTNDIKLSMLAEWTVPKEHYHKFIESLQRNEVQNE